MDYQFKNDIVELAFEKTDEWHKDQKYGDKPYTDHLYDVYCLVMSKVKNMPLGYKNMCLAVALLHDVLEDTEIKSTEITKIFGVPICLAVECLTDLEGENRKERKRKSYFRIRSNEVTSLVKVADRLANMRECIKTDNMNLLKMYIREYDAFYAGIWSPYQYIQDWWDELDEIVRTYQ